MEIDFKLPELGEGVQSADVSRIYVSQGDQIEANQNFMELETEKAVADLPCPHAGRIAKLNVSEGDTIQVGQTLARIEGGDGDEQQEAGEDQDQDQDRDQDRDQDGEKRRAEEKTVRGREAVEVAEADTDQEQHETQPAEDSSPKAEQANGKLEGDEGDEGNKGDEPHQEQSAATRPPGESHGLPPPAGPATRRLARKLGVDLAKFGSPAEGRIRQEDVVRAYVESGKAAALATESLPDFQRFGPIEREPLNRIAQTAARRLASAWRLIPHVTQHGLADITDLEAARRQHEKRSKNEGSKITLTSMAVKSIASLLREFPKFNASLDTEHDEIILKNYYHIGVAVDTDHGLLVPVIRDVDRKSIACIATELAGLADRARRRQLGKGDFEGGTFTISNQGSIGGCEFTPIINYPEVAILGIARARPALRLIDGQPSERLMLPLSLSYDHRVINGADAARFIDRMEKILSDEFSLLIAT